LYLAVLTGSLIGTAAAQTAPKPSLTVTPSSPVNISGPQGGPFSPNPQASKLAPRAYEAPVTFTNVTNGQGTTRTTAKLTVQRSAKPSQGFLLDETGGYLLDNRRERLLAR
jgi:hypothetical protein